MLVCRRDQLSGPTIWASNLNLSLGLITLFCLHFFWGFSLVYLLLGNRDDGA